MFSFSDLFQWDRFITPTIIKTFYWLVIALICLFGLSGIFSGLAAMAISPFGGFLVLLSSIASVVVGIVFSRIVAELILIVFRINEHLGAIRDQGGGMTAVPYVLNLKCITSPSATTYSLPSRRSLPASRAPASPPNAT
jgi:predicted membrane metal-binding protein